MWVHPINLNRVRVGHGLNLALELRASGDERHHSYYRTSLREFDNLLALVEPQLQKQDCVRASVPPHERLSITLRRLATGDSPQSLAFAYRRGVSTIRAVTYETCGILWNMLQPTHLKTPSKEDLQGIATDFLLKWDFPNCIGALDGKHVAIRAPPNSGSNFYNYKKSFSVVLMAICDANYRYTFLDCGEPGRWSDSGVFEYSGLKTLLESLLPENGTLPGTNTSLPYCLVADEAFSLMIWLMRPYPGAKLNTLPRKIFNFRLSRARRTIENCFGITAARWRILLSPINADPANAIKIIKACVIMHNYMRDAVQSYMPPGYADSVDASTANVQQGRWRNEIPPPPADHSYSYGRRYSHEAKAIREEFELWFSGVGNLGWEADYVSRTS